jgi:hypothetical protein
VGDEVGAISVLPTQSGHGLSRGGQEEAHGLLDQVDAGRRTSAQLSTAEQMVAGGWAALERGRLQVHAGALDRAQEHFEDAAVLGREAGADDLLVEALHQQALAEPMSVFAVRLHRLALSTARASSQPSVRSRERELRTALAAAYERAGRPAEAAALRDEHGDGGSTGSVAFPVRD